MPVRTACGGTPHSPSQHRVLPHLPCPDERGHDKGNQHEAPAVALKPAVQASWRPHWLAFDCGLTRRTRPFGNSTLAPEARHFF